MFTNSGKTALTIRKIEVSGSSHSDFEVTSTCGSSLEADKSCTLQITFTPRGQGAQTAVISIVDDAPGGPRQVCVEGIGTRPEIKALPLRRDALLRFQP